MSTSRRSRIRDPASVIAYIRQARKWSSRVKKSAQPWLQSMMQGCDAVLRKPMNCFSLRELEDATDVRGMCVESEEDCRSMEGAPIRACASVIGAMTPSSHGSTDAQRSVPKRYGESL